VFSGTSKISCMHTRLATLRPLMLTALCFAIALGVMAFIPRPVEPDAALESLPLEGTEEDVLPLNPDWFKAGSPMDEWQTFLSPIGTELPVVTYNNAGELQGESDRNTSPVSSIHQRIITLEPPHLWHGFQSKNSKHSNENRTRDGTTSTRNALGGSSIGSVPQHADSFCRKFFSYSPTSRVPIHSRASMTRPAVGGKNTPAAKVSPNRTSTFPKLLHDASSPIPLRNSPPVVTMTRNRNPATKYPPTVFPVSNNTVLTPPWGDSPPTYPDHARTTTPNVYSFHSAPANVLSIEVQPTPYTLLPSVPTLDVARFQSLSAFWGPKDISSGNNAAGGSNAPPMRSVSQPRKPVQRPGVSTAHRVSMPPIEEIPLSAERQ
jgi:hypothetical protein